MVLYHHEREDGKGYPRGLKGSEIPLGARVIAVADAYDAMTTDRPYRSGKTSREATQILMNGSGSQWNKDIVDALLAALKNERPDSVYIFTQNPQEAEAN
jgi:HD-GYP domain-containing protein (c-di-GMP phosphodiesterase class II)